MSSLRKGREEWVREGASGTEGRTALWWKRAGYLPRHKRSQNTESTQRVGQRRQGGGSIVGRSLRGVGCLKDSGLYPQNLAKPLSTVNHREQKRSLGKVDVAGTKWKRR